MKQIKELLRDAETCEDQAKWHEQFAQTEGLEADKKKFHEELAKGLREQAAENRRRTK